MVIYLVCFDLSATLEEQREQIFFWLQFLHSSIPNLPRLHSSTNNGDNNSSDKNWRVIIVGLKSDLKSEATFELSSLQSWQSQMPHLPFYCEKLFEVSSLQAQQSVQDLLESISSVCSEIFEKHAVLIPSSFRKLLKSIKETKDSTSTGILSLSPSSNPVLITLGNLHQQLKGEGKCDMDLPSFKHALRYFHAIGQIVLLQNELVCTEPTIIPKLLAKFISPVEVQNRLLSKNSKVQILSQQQIGFVLQIDRSDHTSR